MPPGQAWTDCPGSRNRWIPSQSHLAAALKHRSIHQWGPGVKGSTGGVVLGPLQEPPTVGVWSTGAARAHFGVFLRQSNFGSFGVPFYTYNKLHKAQIPCPVQNLQARREGSTPALQVRQGYMAEPLQERFPPAQPCAPAANPGPMHPMGWQKGKAPAERGGARREAAKPSLSRDTWEKLG